MAQRKHINSICHHLTLDVKVKINTEMTSTNQLIVPVTRFFLRVDGLHQANEMNRALGHLCAHIG